MVKRLAGKFNVHNQSGQALVEYTLILFVMLALLAMLRQIYTPLQQWTDKHFTDYLACLIETGELPYYADDLCSSGGYGDLKNRIGNVNIQASPSSTSPGSGTSTGGRTSKSRSNTQSSNTSSSRRSTSKSPTSTPSQTESQSSGNPLLSGRTRSISRRNPNARFGDRVGQQANKKSQSDGDRNAKTGSNLVDANNGEDVSLGRGRVAGKKSNRLQDGRGFYVEKEEETRDKNLKSESKRKKVESGETSQRPTRMKASIRKPKVAAEEDAGFTFGDFLRTIIIIAIIIAIFFLVGGQALQVSKSTEK